MFLGFLLELLGGHFLNSEREKILVVSHPERETVSAELIVPLGDFNQFFITLAGVGTARLEHGFKFQDRYSMVHFVKEDHIG
jgi:hypothetical protein